MQFRGPRRREEGVAELERREDNRDKERYVGEVEAQPDR